MTRAELILRLAEDVDADRKIQHAKELKDYRTKKDYTKREVDRATLKGGAAVVGGYVAGKGIRKAVQHVQDRGGAKQVAHSAGIALKRKITGE